MNKSQQGNGAGHPLQQPQIVVRWPREIRTSRRGQTETDNFQCCDLVTPETIERGMPLAAVYRQRKTKRSAWVVTIRPMESRLSGVSIPEFRAHFEAIATAAESIQWPEVAP